MQKMNRMQQWIASGYIELADTLPLRTITVKKICDHVQINRSTFYYHFESIQHLIHWIYHEEVNEPILKKIRKEPDHLEQITVIGLSNIYRRRDFWGKVLHMKTSEEFIQFMLRDTIENWKEVVQCILENQGICRDDLTWEQNLELDYITEYYCSAHYHVTLLWMKQCMKLPPEKLADIIDSTAINGFFFAVNKVANNL